MSVYEIPTLYCGIMREKKPIKAYGSGTRVSKRLTLPQGRGTMPKSLKNPVKQNLNKDIIQYV